MNQLTIGTNFTRNRKELYLIGWSHTQESVLFCYKRR